MKLTEQSALVGLLLPAGLATAQPAAVESARLERDVKYASYVRELAQKGSPRLVDYAELREALRGYQVVVEPPPAPQADSTAEVSDDHHVAQRP